MMSEQEKREFLLSTIRPMADYTMPYLTQVVGVIDDRTGMHCGSGLLCQILGRQAIVTARHVLVEMGKRDEFKSIAFTRGTGESPGVVPGVIVSSREVDLAVYLPDQDFPVNESKAFWPEERIETSRSTLSRDYLFVQGFPMRFSRPTISPAGNAIVSDTLAYGAMMRLTENDIPIEERDQFISKNPDDPLLPSGYLKPHQFALNFSTDPTSFLDDRGNPEIRPGHIEDWSELFRTAGEHENLPGQKQRGAFGISGSPIWRIGISGLRPDAWTPERSVLVGIVTDWHADRGILLATTAASIYEIEGIKQIERDDTR